MWIARNKDGKLRVFKHIPARGRNHFINEWIPEIPNWKGEFVDPVEDLPQFSHVTWEGGPVEAGVFDLKDYSIVIEQSELFKQLKDCHNCKHKILFKSTREYELFVKAEPEHPCIACDLDKRLNNWEISK